MANNFCQKRLYISVKAGSSLLDSKFKCLVLSYDSYSFMGKHRKIMKISYPHQKLMKSFDYRNR